MKMTRVAGRRRASAALAAATAVLVLQAGVPAQAAKTPGAVAGAVTVPPPAGSAAAAALRARHHLSAPATAGLVPGHHAHRTRRPNPIKRSQIAKPAPAARWPGAGQAAAPVGQTSKKGGGWVQVGKLPIEVAPAGKSAGQGAAASAAPLTRVAVAVAAHQQAVAAGADGMIFSVTRADGRQGSGQIRIRISYNKFASAYGAGFGARLALFAAPSCSLTTPQRRACRGMVPVRFVNDAAARTITAVVTAAPGRPAGITGHGGTGSVVYAVASTTSGGSGDYKATSLSPASSWSTDLHSGDFTWSYSMRTPPPVGGSAPSLGLSYESGATDGETAQSNSQPGLLGEGFSLSGAGGFIERKYTSCGDLITAGSTNTGQPSYEPTGDECWDGMNAYISSGSHSGPLVLNSSDQTWHLAGDDGSTVQFLNGANNGAYNGSYWLITAPDGTKYYYGKNMLPGPSGSQVPTNSVWTMPVYGIRSGDPCNQPATGSGNTYAQSVCTNMPWRWNLDLVVDPNGNATAYYYTPETNYYATDSYSYYDSSGNITSNYGTAMQYDSGGRLTDIWYGMQDNGGNPNVYAGQAVHVALWYADRCSLFGNDDTADFTNSAVISNCDSHHNQTDWPDTPWDMYCATAAGCNGADHVAPAFFNTQMLYHVKTEIYLSAGNAETVDSWTLGYDWLASDVNSDLVLASVQHQGWVAGSATLPPVTFGWTGFNNRVNYGESFPLMYLYRLSTVISETGAQTVIGYNQASCSTSEFTNPLYIPNNTMPCFPQEWTGGDFGGPPTLLWYYKYTVASVTTYDPTGGSPPVSTAYVYCNDSTPQCNGTGTGQGGAWHYDTDQDLVPAKYKSWDEWRGYRYVHVITGTGAAQSETDYTFLRGMSGDPVCTASCTSANPTWSYPVIDLPAATTTGTSQTPASMPDDNALDGFQLEKITYDGLNGQAQVSDQVNWPVDPPAVTGTSASQPWGKPVKSEITQTAETDTYAPQSPFGNTLDNPLATGPGTLQAQAVYAWNGTTGQLQHVASTSDVNHTNGELTCTSYTYPTSSVMLTYPDEVTTTAGWCSNNSAPVVSDTKYFYDGQSWSAAPTNGNVSETDIWEPANSDTSSSHWVQQSRDSYDSYGRLTASENSAGFTTHYTYGTQAAGYVTTSVAVQSPLTASTSGTTTTYLNPEWGTTAKVTDASGENTTWQSDALGRVTGIWLPGQPLTSAANYSYSYTISAGGVSWVSTTELTGPQQVPVTSFQLYDSLLRLRQTQTPAEGPAGNAEISDTLYDTQGRAATSYGPYTSAVRPSGTLWITAAPDIPDQTASTYDGAGRVIEQDFISYGTTKWFTQWQYPYADKTSVIPPAGGTTTTTLTDGRGRPVEIRQYHTTPSPGSAPAGDYDATDYTYSDITSGASTGGTLTTATDPGGNTWTWTSNRLGQQTAATDPDTGSTSQSWNDLGQLVSATDGAGDPVSWKYDAAGRKLAEYAATVSGQANGNMLDQWAYDTATLAGGNGTAIGSLATATSYTGGSGGGTGTENYAQTISSYNRAYQPTSVQWAIPSAAIAGTLAGSYTFGYSYNSDGTPASITYPSAGGLTAETVNYGYDNLGSPYSAWSSQSDYVQQALYTPAGLPAETDLGTTATSPWTRMLDTYGTATLRLTDARVQQENSSTFAWTPVTDTSYTYDPTGNVLSADNTIGTGTNPPPDNQCFQYDYLARLTAAWTQTATTCPGTAPVASGIGSGPAPYEQTFTYDNSGTANGSAHGTTGNLTATTLITGAPGSQTTTQTSYGYPSYGSPQPHARSTQTVTVNGGTPATSSLAWTGTGSQPGYLTTITNSGTTTASYTWDGTGMPPGQIASATTNGTATSYRYDASGNLLLVADGTGTSATTTLYLPGEELTSTGGATPVATRDYTFAGQVIAARNPAGLTWLLPDPQGTATTSITTSGGITTRYYTPYGQPRGTPASFPGTRGYINGTTDTTTDLTNLGARQYNPATPAFISPDPLLNPYQPTDLNPYQYAGGNPVTNTDPTGLVCVPGQSDNANCSNPPIQKQPTQPGPPTGSGGDSGSSGTSTPTPVAPVGCSSASESRYSGCNPSLPPPSFTGGAASFFAGVGGNFVALADLGGCIANPLGCAYLIATGHTLTESYTSWLAAHHIQTGLNSDYGAGFGVAAAITGMISLATAPADAAAVAADAPEAAAAGDATSAADSVPQGGVYSLRNAAGDVVRTGRSSNLAAREAAHFNDPVLGQFRFQVEYRTDVYAEQRGLEQILYDRYPGAQSVNGGFNKIRPINPANYDKLANYIEAAFQYLGG